MEEYLEAMGIALAECHANRYTFLAKMSSAILLHQAGLTKHEEAKTFAAASVNTIAGTTGVSAMSTALCDLWGGGKTPSQTGGPALVTITKAEHQALLARRITPAPRTPGRRDTPPPPPPTSSSGGSSAGRRTSPLPPACGPQRRRNR